ncbi:hypothetical protein [Arcobacter sp. CECT 8985]|uniref:hypothetical protein n=1 Tax=Arcobacter sp. CECT 8985 TaxID=1935424 RepID=UPI0013E95DE8|nr:hypothetical protein [Arcobacter sp. CECT 8985]
MLVVFCILIIQFTFKIDYKTALENFLTVILIFSLITFSYFLIFARKNERKNILSIYRVYYSIVVMLALMIYFTYKDAITFYSDYYKNKIAYDLTSNEVDNSFSKYQEFFDKNIIVFEETEIKNKETGKTTDRKTIFFINIASTVMVLITIFSFTWFVYEINLKRYFKRKRNLKKREKIDSQI